MIQTTSLVGQRHNFATKSMLLNDDGTMNDLAFEFAGMDRFEARKAKSLPRLKEIGALVGESKTCSQFLIAQNVPVL